MNERFSTKPIMNRKSAVLKNVTKNKSNDANHCKDLTIRVKVYK